MSKFWVLPKVSGAWQSQIEGGFHVKKIWSIARDAITFRTDWKVGRPTHDFVGGYAQLKSQFADGSS